MLLEKGRDAIVVRGLDDTIISWNRGAERLYGWAAGEVIGRKALELLHKAPAEENACVARKAVLGEGDWSGKLSQNAKDGRIVHVECHWTLVCDEEGRPKSIIEINTDITEKNLIEAQFLRAQRVEGIGSLASGIVHDLNNLLTPILLSVDILKTQYPDEANKGLFHAIDVSAKRAADVVKQVLYFAKGVECEQTDLQPSQFIGEFETMARETFPKSIRIRTHVPAETWLVKADSTQMHQVLLNLCVNARDAMPNGGTISISAENVHIDPCYAASVWGLKPGPYVVIKVSDTGTGIPSEVIDKIFEPFFTTKDVGKGTGLGLSTVFGILKNHGGTITVRSEQGSGTTFHAYLPAVMVAPPNMDETAEAEKHLGQGELILVVDDEPSILAAAKYTLEASGYRVLTAGDGLEGINIAFQHRDDLAVILTDMMMPIMDGEAMICTLNKITPNLAFIGTSGGCKDYETSALVAGAAQFLQKPYSSLKLLQVMDTVLGR
jgi:PAS domain S-box-containing protein